MPSNDWGTILMVLGAFGLGFIWGKQSVPVVRKFKAEGSDDEDDSSDEELDYRRKVKIKFPRGEYKLALVVRTDLKMKSGKIAAQCGHAAVGAYQSAPEEYVSRWLGSGQAKIALKCPSEEALLELAAAARHANIPTHVVVDAGRTQIAANSRTVLAVGPAPVDLVNSITGDLKLL